jgi:hypothetical protein
MARMAAKLTAESGKPRSLAAKTHQRVASLTTLTLLRPLDLYRPKQLSNSTDFLVEQVAIERARLQNFRIQPLEDLKSLENTVFSLSDSESISLVNRSLDFIFDENAGALRMAWPQTASDAILIEGCPSLVEHFNATFAPNELLQSANSKLYTSRNRG